MFLGETTTAPPPAAEVAKLKALPWITLYTPDGGIEGGHDPHYQTNQGYIPAKGLVLAGAFGPGAAIARANGYTGPFHADGITESIPGESTNIERVLVTAHPSLLAWLKSKGYTVKAAFPNTGQKTGADWTSFWKDGQMVGVNSVGWSNKPGVMGYLTMGILGAIAGGAALYAAGAGAGAGAGASGAATGGGAAAAPVVSAGTATAGAGAVATVAPVVAAPAATTAASSGLIATAVKAAPAVIGAVVKAAAPVIKTQQEIKAKEALIKAQEQMPIAPPAAALQQATGYAPSDRMQFERLPSTRPAWLVPAAIGGGVILLALLLGQRQFRMRK